MGGKGRKRREKNYKAAHGNSFTRLPPPPDPSSLDALPSKLRKIFSFNTSSSSGSAKVSKDSQQIKKGRGGGGRDKKSRANDELDSKNSGIKEGHSGREGVNEAPVMAPQHTDSNDEIVHSNSKHEKKKGKRKRKRVNDLRFEALTAELGVGSKRRERKKKYLEERKRKHKKAKTEENLDFPGREKIKFGEVVEAPPKLAAIPKAFKTAQDASRERLRLRAIESYRNRKAWASRPGIQLPSPVITLPLSDKASE